MSYNRDMPTGNCQKCINTFGTLGCCDTISNEWRYNCDDGMRYFDERKPQTNADRILAMTDEELATFFGTLPCCPPGNADELCFPDNTCGADTKMMVKCWGTWLKAPAEEGEG